MGRKFRGLVIIAALFVAGAAGFAIWLAIPVAPPKAPELSTLHGSAGQGRYLATIANCVSCHTGEGGTPYAGGHAFRTDFGIIYSTNITSDPKAGIGDWSFGQFYDAMRFGLRDDGAHLYPAFPYTSFTKLSDDDIASLFLFLREV
ncbi:MAG TPA: c-type cytochrome, partial [Solimonas sp.]|nr:c-type cytochrome [Solimonas sp.]